MNPPLPILIVKPPTTTNAGDQRGGFPSSIGRPKVLVVDDDLSTLTLLDKLLNKDYIIRKANNGLEAIELAFVNPPDLILVDAMMPNMDGFEVCRRIKDNILTTHVPVIFITGKNETNDEELGFSMGAADFIRKPIVTVIIIARVRSQLKEKFTQDHLREELARLHGGAVDVRRPAPSKTRTEKAPTGFYFNM